MLGDSLNDYALDLDNLFKFVSKDDDVETSETEITDAYDFTSEIEDKNVSKVVRELKGKGNTQKDAFRYDLIKVMLAELFNVEDNYEAYTSGTHIAFNTLLNYNILKKINNE